MKPFIVLDTNIWVGFCANWDESLGDLIQDVASKYEFAFTRETLEELKRVFEIPRIEANTKPELRQIVLGLTSNEKCIFEVTSKVEEIRNDPSDNRFLEAVVASKAQLLVTNDKKHILPLRRFETAVIVSPEEYLSPDFDSICREKRAESQPIIKADKTREVKPDTKSITKENGLFAVLCG